MASVSLKTIEQNDNVSLFSICSAIPDEQKAEFELSFGIAERMDAILKEKNISQRELARRLGKRESEVSRWLTGRHNFTTSTIAKIETALGSPLVQIAR
jgi:ribosome-binding protein aMBF1 (putative translation factor)